jgi:DnaJ-class molecular chaperone
MTEAEREARHPAPQKRCHRCNGTGTVGKASQFVLNERGSVDYTEWDSICPVCEGRKTENAHFAGDPGHPVRRPH